MIAVDGHAGVLAPHISYIMIMCIHGSRQPQCSEVCVPLSPQDMVGGGDRLERRRIQCSPTDKLPTHPFLRPVAACARRLLRYHDTPPIDTILMLPVVRVQTENMITASTGHDLCIAMQRLLDRRALQRNRPISRSPLDRTGTSLGIRITK